MPRPLVLDVVSRMHGLHEQIGDKSNSQEASHEDHRGIVERADGIHCARWRDFHQLGERHGLLRDQRFELVD